MPAWLLTLALAALVFYTDDYVIAGVLPEFAADLEVSVGTAGQLVTAFSVTGAIAAGVPAGTWIGGTLGWRATFAAMAAAGLAVAVAILARLPRETARDDVPALRDRLRIVAAPAASLGLLANVVLMLGSMMLLTYLSPFVAELANGDVGERGALFLVSGLAGMAGISAGGWATDRLGPDRTLLVGVAVFVAAILTFTAL
ncbi:MFS transporter [Prauserella oleivorans]|uniref:MFS transporter n=1 Tax=Prauserella oleivorans TaxID=1478153 RepID=A0ABW5W8X4_9PSEU